MKTLYVTDLDGTLLNTGSRLSGFTRQAMEALGEHGVLWTYATARSFCSADPVLDGLAPPVPAVIYNGAMLFDIPQKKPLYTVRLEPQDAADARVFFNQKGSPSPLVFAFREGKEQVSWVLGEENEGMRYYFGQRPEDPRMKGVSSREELFEGEVFYISCIGSPKELEPVRAYFSGREGLRVQYYQEIYRPEYWCELLPSRATKANAVRLLQEKLGADRLVCFGDALNDLPLFEIADEAYAVENAVPELKAAASGILPGNDADGVARWMLENAV